MANLRTITKPAHRVVWGVYVMVFLLLSACGRNLGDVDPQSIPETGTQVSLIVASQFLTNGTVVVSEVLIPQPGWMVIYNDRAGTPGEVIGYEPLAQGWATSVAIEVDRSRATDTLYAVLHMDGGETGVFEYPDTDTPLQGPRASSSFRVSGLNGDALKTNGERSIPLVVRITDDRFEPREITITAGTAVEWWNEGNMEHTITSEHGLFHSQTITTGGSFKYTFRNPGTYLYYCTLHGGPGGSGMSGKIIVSKP